MEDPSTDPPPSSIPAAPSPPPLPRPKTPEIHNECAKCMSSILTEIEATVTFVPPPPPIDLLTASQALSASASLYQSDYERQSSHVAIHLANMVDTVVDRLTTFPINLRAFSTNLAQSQAKHFRKADPVYIHMNSILDSVEARIEAENRATIKYVLDRQISKIKRRHKKEPSRIIRHFSSVETLHFHHCSYLMDGIIETVAKREKTRQFRDRVLSGSFLPPPSTIIARPVINYHLTYMTSWIEEHSAKSEEISKISNARSDQVAHAKSENAANYTEEKKKLKHSLSVRENEGILKSQESTKASRNSQLKRKKASFPEGSPMPSSEISAFESETSKLVSECKKTEKEKFIKVDEQESAALKKFSEKKEAARLGEINAEFDAKEQALQTRLDALNEGTPGTPPPKSKPPTAFCPPPIYYPTVPPSSSNPVIPPAVYQKRIKNFLFKDFINSIISDDSFNYIADNILRYIPDRDILTLAVTSKTFKELASFHADRAYYATVIENLFRCKMARRDIYFRKLYDRNSRTIQRYGRGINGRNKAAKERHRIKVNDELRMKLGSCSGVVRAFIDGTNSSESIIAAAETLDVIKNSEGGMNVIIETSAATLMVEKMISIVKLNTIVDKTKGGKNEWSSLVKTIGNLDTNPDTVRLIKEKGGGRCLLDMLRRGDSEVREEVCAAITKLCKNKGIKNYLVFDLHCIPLMNHMLRSSCEAISISTSKISSSPPPPYSFKHQLTVIKTLTKIMSDNKYKLTLGRNGVLPQMFKILQNTTKAYTNEFDPTQKTRTVLLEMSSKLLWKMIEVEENYRRVMTATTADTLQIMLSSSWILANRLSLILVSCTVATTEGKLLMKAANVPLYINQHMTSHSADVRAAAMIAVEAFSMKPHVRNLVDLRWKLKAKPKSVKSTVDKEDLVPENMGKQTSDEILLLKTPDGLILEHEGNSYSDTDQYLKSTHIIPAPTRRFRLESALNLEGIPWTNLP
ncbi:hypothetical protein TrLO_g7379 [Triparma laevis f. longispina]|uniref:Uncharacterized protein n=1 Tax=Triparma laevis f. longispina TaxID=1714387 RepID=A0A9W7DY63_9STRA|nr:hypothetical protein TrLO_g7379 [Triparma laevis f. longispina]